MVAYPNGQLWAYIRALFGHLCPIERGQRKALMSIAGPLLFQCSFFGLMILGKKSEMHSPYNGPCHVTRECCQSAGT